MASAENYFTINTSTGAFTNVESSQFRGHSVKPDSVKAVKLTKSNLKAVAAEILKSTKLAVQVDADGIAAGPAPSPVDGGIRPDYYHVGEWIIEDYDYVEDRIVYRPASLLDRQRYDLR